MRPRVFPAEDAPLPAPTTPHGSRFNEAAGIPRGRRPDGSKTFRQRHSFNEAAGIPRGRRGSGRKRRPVRRPGFNEAAGIPRGRRAASWRRGRVIPASMRPRVFPAEDPLHGPRRERRSNASMRPRVFPAEDQEERPARGAENRASMRPRVFPAEDARVRYGRANLGSRFNEAAGIPRGRRSRQPRRRSNPTTLQ